MFNIIITHTRQVKKIIEKQWQLCGEKGKEALDYSPETEGTRTERYTLLEQNLETVDLAAVIIAINQLRSAPTMAEVNDRLISELRRMLEQRDDTIHAATEHRRKLEKEIGVQKRTNEKLYQALHWVLGDTGKDGGVDPTFDDVLRVAGETDTDPLMAWREALRDRAGILE